MNRPQLPFALVIAAVILGWGCASTGSSRRADGSSARILFPPAPAEPVIEWVGSYSRAADLGAGTKAWKRILVGEGEAGAALSAPAAVAMSEDRTIYVVDPQQDIVVIMNLAERRFEPFKGSGNGRLIRPVGVAAGRDGTLYVSDIEQRSVLVFGPELDFRAAFGGPTLFERPTNLALSHDERRLAVCDTRLHQVLVLDAASGELLLTLDGSGGAEGHFNFPVTAAFDNEGYLYVSDFLNHRIQVFDPSGDPELSFGSVGDRPGQLNRPRGLAADSQNGVIYEVDSAFELVQMFNLDGELLMWFGGPGSGPAQFQLPSAIALSGDLLVVADTFNGRVQVFRFLGAPTETARR